MYLFLESGSIHFRKPLLQNACHDKKTNSFIIQAFLQLHQESCMKFSIWSRQISKGYRCELTFRSSRVGGLHLGAPAPKLGPPLSWNRFKILCVSLNIILEWPPLKCDIHPGAEPGNRQHGKWIWTWTSLERCVESGSWTRKPESLTRYRLWEPRTRRSALNSQQSTKLPSGW